MTYIYCGFAAGYFAELAVYLIFGNGIQRSSGLIEDNKWGVFVKCPCKSNFLRFTSGNFNAIFIKIMIKLCFKPIRQLRQALFEARFFQAGGRCAVVIFGAGGHIFSQRKGEQTEILKNYRENGEILIIVIFTYIHAIEQYNAFRRIVKPA